MHQQMLTLSGTSGVEMSFPVVVLPRLVLAEVRIYNLPHAVTQYKLVHFVNLYNLLVDLYI